MRNKRRTDEEQLSLIQQCHSSGLSDRVWCEQNDISINTFYNTVTRLRKKSCMVPETIRPTSDGLLYMPDYMNSSAGIEQLMPWSDFIKEQCSGIIDVESNVPENRIPLLYRQQRNLK